MRYSDGDDLFVKKFQGVQGGEQENCAISLHAAKLVQCKCYAPFTNNSSGAAFLEKSEKKGLYHRSIQLCCRYVKVNNLSIQSKEM